MTVRRWGTRAGATIVIDVACTAAMVSAGAASARTPAAHDVCPAAVVIPARGSGDPAVGPQRYGNSRSDGYEGPLLRTLLTATYRGDRSVASIPVVTTGPAYRAVSVVEGAPTRSFGSSIASGVAAVVSRYDAVSAAGGQGCRPGAVLIGYSQGAAVAREASIALAPRHVVSAVMLFGDPQQIPSAPGAAGTGSTGTGIWRTDATAAFSGVSTVGVDDYYRLPGLQRWALCHAGDAVCDFGPGVDILVDQHQTYLQPGRRFIPSAGRPPSTRTELQVAVATLRGFIRDAAHR